jgi:predicted glutamine amidotransferase
MFLKCFFFFLKKRKKEEDHATEMELTHKVRNDSSLAHVRKSSPEQQEQPETH